MLVEEEAMTAESAKIWRCPPCNRRLIEKGRDYAKARHAELLARTRGGSLGFVREATWPPHLSSSKRCRRGSRDQLQPVPAGSGRAQRALHSDAVRAECG